eukprot:CAMPEP_0181107434 /NCGR_PEP_ID=MMETSP1071-20121207/17085_1 /TAXON_ID=35127 /ORGANISM="Thalassiosira sp., Strain NH16" /LENGTH=239 /DNA_ID=CAMNT_0023190951 /DNA_START=280 /DNA_END=996 /DNA_ORIENTATION=+
MEMQKDSPLKKFIHNHGRNNGLTVHHTRKKKKLLHGASSLRPLENEQSSSSEIPGNFREWKQMKMGRVSDLERRLEDQAKIVFDLKRTIDETQKRHEEELRRTRNQHGETFADLDEDFRQYREFSTYQIKTLEQEKAKLATDYVALSDEKSNLEAQAQTLKSEVEDSQRARAESNATFGKLLEKHTSLKCRQKKLEDEMKDLQTSSWCDIKLANEEKKALAEEAEKTKKRIDELEESNR